MGDGLKVFYEKMKALDPEQKEIYKFLEDHRSSNRIYRQENEKS